MKSFVGYRSVDLIEDENGVAFPMAIMYPTTVPARTERLGPFTLDIAIDAAPKPGAYRLVLVSHGSGGSPMTHRMLAHHLASNGFVVGLPEHPFNNRNDNSLAGTDEILSTRPQHIRTAVDWFFTEGQFSGHLQERVFSVVGHSMGAYTALAVAGGAPTSLSRKSADGHPKRIDVEPKPGIKALVLLAPATPWFRTVGSLSGVRTPIMMLAGDKDEHCPHTYMTRIVLDGVPAGTKVEYRLVENAGHFSFLSPWPAAMRSPAFPPSQDPPGFDRVRFMDELNSEVLDFLKREA
jgi:predicted dienelactone hydrolase